MYLSLKLELLQDLQGTEMWIEKKMLRTVSMTGNAVLDDKSKMGSECGEVCDSHSFGSSFLIDRET